jgi:hypothetical protein
VTPRHRVPDRDTEVQGRTPPAQIKFYQRTSFPKSHFMVFELGQVFLVLGEKIVGHLTDFRQ